MEEYHVFFGCEKLTELILPYQTSKIEALALGDCVSLQYLFAPSVTEKPMLEWAFRNDYVSVIQFYIENTKVTKSKLERSMIMYTTANYFIILKGNDDQNEQAKAFLEEKLGERYNIWTKNSIYVEEDNVFCYLDIIIAEVAKEIASLIPDISFNINGTINSDGHRMDFDITYSENKLTLSTSPEYELFCADDFEDYEDFCECYCEDGEEPPLTEDVFDELLEGFCEDEYYVLENGTIVKEDIPKSSPIEI